MTTEADDPVFETARAAYATVSPHLNDKALRAAINAATADLRGALELAIADKNEAVSLLDAATAERDAAVARAEQRTAAFDLRTFSAANRERCTSPQGFNHVMESWSLAEWTNAMAGECGEAANITKKLLRHRDGVGGNYKPGDDDVEELRRRAAKECADVIIYADLCIQAAGFDTATVLADVWNKKSEDVGYVGRWPAEPRGDGDEGAGRG